MALIGSNIDDGMYEGLRKASEFKGAPTLGIGGPGDTKILRFDPHVVKKHIKKWVETRPKYKFMGIGDLISAEKHGQLRQGQLIFQEIPVSHHEQKDGYAGWIYNLFSPLLTIAKTRQCRSFAYFHVAIYVGSSCVVENGGYDFKNGCGTIALRDFDDAFQEETYGKSRYFVVSPPKDKAGRSTRYLVCQKAFASIGVQFKYHMKAVSCETFATAMLGNIDEVDFEPIQSEIIRFHKKDLKPGKQEEKLEQCIKKFKRFYKDLRSQIAKVPAGIVLTLDYYLNRPSKNSTPWFMQMIDSYKHFHAALKTGDSSKCTSLLDMGLSMASTGTDNYTPLMYAAEAGHASLCKVLLNRSGDMINLKNKSRDTALICATRNGHVETCKVLIDRAADVNQPAKMGKTCLMIASEKGVVDLVSHLLNRGADVNQRDRHRRTALMYAAEGGQTDACRLLLANEADINLQHEDGETALMIAAHNGYVHVCRELCEKGADVDIRDKFKNTALMHATYEGHTQVCSILIEHGAENATDSQGSTPLMHAAYEGKLDVSIKLIHAFPSDVNRKNNIGRSALMYAATQGHVGVVRELSKGGADVNDSNKYGRTVLMYGAREGHHEVCVELIRYGADLDLQDGEGCSALMIAAQVGAVKVYEELVSHGADTTLISNAGATALNLAHQKVLSHLKQT